MADIALLHRTGVAARSSRPSTEQKIRGASQEFESVLLGQWLKEAEDSFGSVPGGDDDGDSGQMKNFAMQHLAREITKSGGIGISKIVEGALSTAAGLSQSVRESAAESGKDINIPESIEPTIGRSSNVGESNGK